MHWAILSFVSFERNGSTSNTGWTAMEYIVISPKKRQETPKQGYPEVVGFVRQFNSIS